MKMSFKSFDLMRHIKIRAKMLIGYLILTILIAVVVIVSWYSFNDLSRQVVILQNFSEVDLDIAIARIEQVRYEKEQSVVSRELIGEKIEEALALTEQTKLLITSQAIHNVVGQTENAILGYRDEFAKYVTEESHKNNVTVRLDTVSKAILSGLEEAISLAKREILKVDDSVQLADHFKSYDALKEAMVLYSDMRLAEQNYIHTLDENYKEIVLYKLKKIDGVVDRAKQSIQGKDMLTQLSDVIDEVKQYKSIFGELNTAMQDQVKIVNAMRQSAQLASELTQSINQKVLDYIDKFKAQALMLSLGIALGALLIAFVVSYITTRSITRPINATLQHVKQIASYDLANDVSPHLLNRKDEIGALTAAVQEITVNLRTIIGNIKDNASTLSTSSQQLNATAQNSSQTANEIARTVEEISQGAVDQAMNTEQGTQAVVDLGEFIVKQNEQINALSKISAQVKTLKDQGLAVVETLVDGMDSNHRSATLVYQAIESTNQSAQRIENASSMIKNISDQTNLLALNAAIEAARAGEAGRGFSVVADEIRKLAEQSSAFTDEISSEITDLIQRVDQAVSNMKKAVAIVEEQTTNVDFTNDKFQGIADSVEQMDQATANIASTSLQMDQRKARIIDIIESLSATAQENAASTEQVTASIELQTTSSNEISVASTALAKLADKMKEVVIAFKL